ncbi:hypothetical protein Tco_0532165 [Tanacetum coccineum]
MAPMALSDSEITDKSKKGLGYSAVPPPHPLIYNRSNKLDLSYSGLEEFQQPEFEGYGLRANKSVCENSLNETKKNSDAPLIEEWVSDNEDEVESPIMVEKKTVVPTIPKVDVVRPKQQKNQLGKQLAVLMRSGIKAVNTAKPKDAHNAVKRNRFNTVKASACWVWMPKNRVIDHGRNNAQIDEDHFSSDGCTNSGEAGVQQRQKIMMKGRGFPEKNEVLFSEEVTILKREVGIKQYEINMLKTEFEKVKQEKDGIEFKIEKFDKALKDLDQLVNKSVCENSSNETKKNSNAPLIEEWVFDNEDEVESPIIVEKKTVVPTIPKVDVVRPKQQEKLVRKTVRYAEMYRSQKPRGNQRNWNNQKSQQLGIYTVKASAVGLDAKNSMNLVDPSKPGIGTYVKLMKIFSSVGCTKLRRGRSATMTKDLMKGSDFQVNHKFRGGLLGIKPSALSTAQSKAVKGLKTAGYKVSTTGSKINADVKKLMLLVQVNAVRHNLMLFD